jgi:hypothetical protein
MSHVWNVVNLHEFSFHVVAKADEAKEKKTPKAKGGKVASEYIGFDLLLGCLVCMGRL